MSEADPSPPNTTARVLGVILMIVGYMLLSGAGLCTLIFGGAALWYGSAGVDVWYFLIYGSLPMIVGALIAWAGHSLWRSGAGR